MTDIEIKVPTSLRYTFKQSLDYFPVTKNCKPNYLIAGLLYNNSLLEENLEAQPFPYLEDDRLRFELKKTGYFLVGSEHTIVRRIEDFVVLDYKPSFTTPTELQYPNYQTPNWLYCHLAPVTHKLQRQVAYLEQQVKDLPTTVFQSWISAHHKICLSFQLNSRSIIV